MVRFAPMPEELFGSAPGAPTIYDRYATASTFALKEGTLSIHGCLE